MIAACAARVRRSNSAFSGSVSAEALAFAISGSPKVASAPLFWTMASSVCSSDGVATFAWAAA